MQVKKIINIPDKDIIEDIKDYWTPEKRMNLILKILPVTEYDNLLDLDFIFALNNNLFKKLSKYLPKKERDALNDIQIELNKIKQITLDE